MMRRDIAISTAALSWLLTLCCSAALAQDPVTSRRVEGRQQAVGAEVVINQIETSAFPKVTLFALVSRSGVPLKGLGPDDFRVREDEVDQYPLTVVPQLSALNAVITLDTSGSMRQRIKDAQAAAKSFIDMLGPEDSVRVVSFARDVKVLNSGGDRSGAKAAIDATVARGDTALYDALYTSVDLLRGVPGRKVVALLSDGADDNGQGRPLSKHSVDEVLALAREVNVPIYTIGVGTEIDEALLRRVAHETGGATLITPQPGQLTELYARIGEQLAGQYNIFYTSNLPADGTEHRVQLRYAGAWGTKEYKAPLAKEAKPQPKPAPEAWTPPPSPPKAEKAEIKAADILTPQYAELVLAPSAKWEGLLTGSVELETRESEHAVFGFKGDRTATFDTVRICIQETHSTNIKSLEVLVSADSPSGPFESVGTFQPQNVRIHKTGGWQEFTFAPVTARYVKLKATSGQGYYFRVDKIEGGGKSLQLLGKMEP
jgi:VWFA-related protein